VEVILSSVTEKMYDACACICVQVLEYSNLVGQIPTSFRVRGEGVLAARLFDTCMMEGTVMFNKPYPPSFVASFIITAPILSLLVTRRVLCTPMVGTLTCKSQSNSLRSSSSAIFKQVEKSCRLLHLFTQFFSSFANASTVILPC